MVADSAMLVEETGGSDKRTLSGTEPNGFGLIRVKRKAIKAEPVT